VIDAFPQVMIWDEILLLIKHCSWGTFSDLWKRTSDLFWWHFEISAATTLAIM